MLTAERRDEVAEATWDEINLDKGLWHLPRHRTKNGREHVVHLAPAAVEIMEQLPRVPGSNFLFTTTGRRSVSGFGRARVRVAGKMRELGGGAAIEPFTLHDLRRSAATGMAEIGIAHHVVDKVLNHSSGAISGIARIYNRNEYLAERKVALETWARHVTGLVSPPTETENIIEFAVAG